MYIKLFSSQRHIVHFLVLLIHFVPLYCIDLLHSFKNRVILCDMDSSVCNSVAFVGLYRDGRWDMRNKGENQGKKYNLDGFHQIMNTWD